MQSLLADEGPVLDAGAAGTTFRFLTAYCSIRGGTQVLTGTARMKQRPIGVLVDALRQLGASISYLEEEGYPPIKIGPPLSRGTGIGRLVVPASTSSQYLSALLMIAPTLPEGLRLTMEGRLVSRPYLEMTLRMMSYFGIEWRWEDDTISVEPQEYQGRPFVVEADWSAASYYYALAAMSEVCDIRLHGLFADSWQGDAVLPGMMEHFGVRTEFVGDATVRLTKEGRVEPVFEWDFLPCPDLAQTIAVVCGALGVPALFSGLETLRIKETDRIAALQQELSKVGTYLSALPPRFSKRADRQYFHLEGMADGGGVPVFDTYEDHRMAMAFATLGLLGPVVIRQPEVVEKSYPTFWADLSNLGFQVEMMAG
ncbi:MAG: hypothetical protein RLY31_1352 [Bacteroidota bacterium]|jgi:3-phosphoshikimate 1-carboxyvinyltransferase